MPYNFQNTGIIILAAGRGKRLGCVDIPKVMCELNGRPIISYILEVLENGGVDKNKISIVVGFQKGKIMEKFSGYIYAPQEELLGTAHAALTGARKLQDGLENFLVINGDDSAFYTFETLNDFVGRHLKNKNDITLLTCEKENPEGLGRIIRNDYCQVIAVREKENLTAVEENIKEVSTGTYCFRREWFREIYPALKPIANLGEYGLPAFVEEALKIGAKFEAVKLENPDEWFGINTREQLKMAEALKKKENYES
ncbi:MAG: sugar phosphate nucleotidyltransferase [bacterium]